MKDYLKHYRVRITALSPIYVGDGKLIGKKEYIRRNRRAPVEIPDQRKMAMFLLSSRASAFEKYMLDGGSNAQDLYQWLQEQRIPDATISSWIRYSMDTGDTLIEAQGKKDAPQKEIQSFQKDAYGKPYIPGSSLKGMLRTVLFAWELGKRSGSDTELADKVRRAAREERGGRGGFLQNEAEDLECRIFHKLDRNPKKRKDAVNSVMAGLIVGDSDEISVKRLVLCQKIDYGCDRKEGKLPILREALQPGTEIFFDLSIDETIFPYKIEDIFAALDFFQELCYERFYKYFKRGRNESGIVWLGGGVGFVSKTVIQALLSPEDALEVTDHVFRATISKKNYEKHKHEKDLQLGISPHVCKCTYYLGELCDMGMGRIELLRRV